MFLQNNWSLFIADNIIKNRTAPHNYSPDYHKKLFCLVDQRKSQEADTVTEEQLETKYI